MSRSLVERLAALVLAGGILFSSTMSSVHDPACPHHASRAADVAAHEGHEGHAPPPAESASRGAGHDTAGDGAPEECRCKGGLCALVALEAPIPSAPALIAGSAEESEARLVPRDVIVRAHVDRSQPPGRAPPTTV